jgi:hypothetical protein
MSSLLRPARRQRSFQLLQHQRLIRPRSENRLEDIRRQQRQLQDPAQLALRDVLGVADLADRGVDTVIELRCQRHAWASP